LLHNALNPGSPEPLPFVLDDLTATTASAPKQNLLEVGDNYYLDRTFTLTSIPTALQDGRWIMSNNADKTINTINYLSFSVDAAQDVDIYIAYDDGATSLPTWMTDDPDADGPLGAFTDTGLLINTTDTSTPVLRLYKSYIPAGNPIPPLGGNLQGGATGANSNYVVIVVALP